MKIALFIPSLRGGGAERVWVTLANEFAKRGYDVDLLLAEKAGPYLELVSDQVNIIDFQKGRVLTSLFPLVRYLKKNKPAALLSAMNHTNIVSLWAKTLSGSNAKFIVSVRNAMEHNNTIWSQASVLFINLMMRCFYPRAYAITAVSEGLSEYLRNLLPSQRGKIITIYNPVVTPETEALMNKTVSHPWLNTKAQNNPSVILAAGRLNVQKDYGTLIRAFSLIRKTINARLIVLGKGEERASLEHLIEKLGLKADVDLPGFVENPFAYMNKADLFVLSSKWEGLPGVLIQAMACGTPVVSTDCPHGPAEILENGKWGSLVPVGDIDALAKAMLETLERKEHPDVAMRATYFTVDKSVNQYFAILSVSSEDEGKKQEELTNML